MVSEFKMYSSSLGVLRLFKVLRAWKDWSDTKSLGEG